MKRLGLVLATCGCTPTADTVGAWTTDGGSESASSPTTDPIPVDDSTTSAAEPSSSESSSTSSSTSNGATSTGTGAAPPWVATIGPGLTLRALDLEGGMIVDVCALEGIGEPDALAFLPDGRLVGSHAASATLWFADPCDCTVTAISPPEAVALHALAEREGPAVVGVDALRAGLFEVLVDDSGLFPLAELADAGAILAIAAIPGSDDVWAIVKTGDLRLQRFDSNGIVVQDEPLTIPADASGLTLDPDGVSLLACDDDGTLWRIDPDDGASEALVIASPDACRTLATPHGTIACIDALFGA